MSGLIGDAKKQIEYRTIYREEWQEAMDLAWCVFTRFIAPQYSDEGIENFHNFVTDDTLHKMFIVGSYQVFGAFVNNQMVGVISVRGENHISLLFVEEEYQRLGVGAGLMMHLKDYAKAELGVHELTVDAAPGSLGFYHKMGFRDTMLERTTDGIRYTPMRLRL